MPTPDLLSRPVGRGFNRVTLMLGGLVFLVGVIPLVAALVLFQLHSQAEMEKAEITAHRMATLLMRSFEQAVEPIDALLQNFASGHDTTAAPYQIYEQLKDFNVPASLVQLAVTDKNGVMVATSLAPPGPEKVDLSDREHIRVHMGKDPAKGQLFISKPVLGRVSKKWTIQLTRPLSDAQGQFAGVVVASYAISDFIDFYKQLRTEEGELIALMGTDGIARARATSKTSFGDDISKSAAFIAAMQNGGGTYHQASTIDGVERVGYTVRSGKYPILVSVAYSTDFVRGQTADFKAAIWSTAAGLSIALLVMVAVGGSYLNLQKRLEAQEVQALARLREANVLDAISRVPGVSVMHVTPDGATEIGSPPDGALGCLMRNYLGSRRFRNLVEDLSEPRHINEHLSDGETDVEAEIVVAPLQGMDRGGSGSQEVVVVAVDQTQRRMEEHKLYQMSKLASLGEVATGLAHEINQPLGVIRLAASNALTGMKMGLPPEHLVSKLDRIVQQTVRMSRIIDHMRIFGRKSDEHLQPSRPIDAVEGALQVVGAHLRLDNVEVRTTQGPDIPQVLCRQDQLEQVIINLIQNARDAIVERRARTGKDFPGLIHLTVGSEPGKAGRVLRIRVEDNGGGIPDDVRERIFQPFFTTKPPGKGTGLGLSVSFGIIRDHGGSLGVENGEGGAVFTIELPALEEEQAAKAV
ncbi:ATP-binding protein [Xanthobacter sp. YC-JY1]|uniref:ATP-binding protein n=1 Tax=Xanthobacter sp. YC-JY1 TaxID=2419844 RepID=UPI001F2AFAA9|nr:ATP-binding protein [Xanthobacter sp. YC-JY1]